MTAASWNLCSLGFCLAATAAGCHGPAPAPPTGVLVLSVVPQRSTVLLDDRPLLVPNPGQQPARFRLSVGPHRIEVRAMGHLARFYDVAIQAGADAVISASLHPDPEAEPDSTPASTEAFAPRARELPTLP